MATNEINLNMGVAPGRKTVTLYNRCGGTVLKGTVVAVNAAFAAAAGEAMASLDPKNADIDGPTGYWASAAINPTTANRNYYLAVADKDVPDNAVADFVIEGEVDLLVPTGANAGDLVHGTNGSRVVTVLPLANVGALATAVPMCGHLLQANASGVNALVRAVFKGDELWSRIVGV